jgi:ElaB/YqjD/DUF883 family membrane-anchored ribosome-binding protein
MNESEMAQSDVTMKKFVADFKLVLQDAEALAKATAGEMGDKIKEARARLASSMETAKETYHKVEEKAAVGAKATDKVIREHPYESIGVAFGAGILLGVLVGRK